MTEEQLNKIAKITERLQKKGELSKHEFNLINNLLLESKKSNEKKPNGSKGDFYYNPGKGF